MWRSVYYHISHIKYTLGQVGRYLKFFLQILGMLKGNITSLIFGCWLEEGIPHFSSFNLSNCNSKQSCWFIRYLYTKVVKKEDYFEKAMTHTKSSNDLSNHHNAIITVYYWKWNWVIHISVKLLKISMNTSFLCSLLILLLKIPFV